MRNKASFARRHHRAAARLGFAGLLIIIFNFFLQRNRENLSKHLLALAPGAVTRERGVPKIALLFLTRGPLAHEATWNTWFDVAGYVIPRKILIEECDQGLSGVESIKTMCGALHSAASGGYDVIAAQMLFSVYVHAPSSFEGYHPDSLWALYRIFDRIETRWGDFSLTAATKALLKAAVANPLNQRFVLISESDIPLYDPLTFYMQLMSEETSRVSACAGGTHTMPYRWSDKMKTEHMNSSHWRKSSQWFALQRKHAEIVVNDQEVEESFKKYCNLAMDPDLGRVRDCISDEHYIPVLMAVHNVENEMDCSSWGISALDWSRGGAHPKSYDNPLEITQDLIYSLRGGGEKGIVAADQAQKTAQKQFLPCGMVPKTLEECTKVIPPPEYEVLGGGPMLLARKFPAGSAVAVNLLLKECSNSSGLGLLTGRPCS